MINAIHIESERMITLGFKTCLFVNHLIRKLNSEKDYQIKGISKKSMQIFMNYNWPRNIRELENALEQSKGEVLQFCYSR